MTRQYLLPVIAVLGVGFGLYMMAATTKPPQQSKPVAEPSKAPFAAYVFGAGLIEASTENVKVGSPTGGLVTTVYVKVGDQVKKGQPLWQLEDGPKRAELARYEAAGASAEATLDKLRKGNRLEDIRKQEQQLAQVNIQLDDARAQLVLREGAATEDLRAISQDEVNQARHAVRQREAAVAYQQAELDRLKTGTWTAELRVQQAAVREVRAQILQTKVDVERLTVRSPLAGEYAPAAQTDDALMLVGNNELLNVRVDVDEQDAWRVDHAQPAVAYPRGRSDLNIPLTFVRVEPYVVPKKSLTGASTERVDTRVLQVVYSFRQRHDFSLYVGQQMDVYIQAQPLPDPGAQAPPEERSQGGNS
ncbi:MAG: biotin/lipoyl-binding protein [Nitrospira sp.]|nr:biotin/lipoyl-binding protein [Nitrospira sp.]